MKTFTLVAAFAPVALAAFDNTCAYLSGGPSNEARTAVVDLVKRTWLPLDPGGSNGWTGISPMWCALCQGAVISIKDSGWDGADRHVTPEDLDKVMGTFPEGGKECGNSVDGSGGYMGVLFGNDNDWDMSSCRPEYTVNC